MLGAVRGDARRCHRTGHLFHRGRRHPARDAPVTTNQSPERAAASGLIVNAVLAAAKLVTGILGHSFALVADSVESMVDIAVSLVVWRALHYGSRPPDEEHPFGHGKAEALAALAVGVLIIIAGIGIAVEAIDGVMQP